MANAKQEYVTVTIPYIEGEGDSQWVCDNGKTYLIKKGEPVEVPSSVAEILQQANTQAMVIRQVKKNLKDQNNGEM